MVLWPDDLQVIDIKHRGECVVLIDLRDEGVVVCCPKGELVVVSGEDDPGNVIELTFDKVIESLADGKLLDNLER